MPSPNSSVHWFSAVVFLAGFACFLGWGINEYNQLVEDSSDDLPQPQQLENSKPVSIQPPPVPPVLSSPNIVPFRTREVSPSPTGEMTPQEFYEQLQQEDIWLEGGSDNQSIS